MLSIGQVAKQLDIGVETVRYYEREGLLEKPDRKPSGYRQYDNGVVRRILFIRQAKTLGFTLKEIRELLSLKNDPGTDCSELKVRAKKKIEEVKNKIASLQKIEDALEKIIQTCPGSGSLGDCPMLEYLEIDNTGNDRTNNN